MPTLGEARKMQDEQVERLRKLQWDKAVAPVERREAIQKEIDGVSKDISDLDTVIQGFMNEARSKR
jgi:hypothetical protein